MKKRRFNVVVGLGKTGLSCVRYLVNRQESVAVVDSRANPPGLTELSEQFPQVKVYLGGWHEEVLAQGDELIISPGVSVKEPAIVRQANNGKSIIGDIELFARAVNAPVVAITGSNGKSTVTTLVGEMAKDAGLTVQVGGNLGMPALDLLTEPNADLYVLELSSFQLETTFSLVTLAATVLNITPDHLDRYNSFAEYAATKMTVYHNCYATICNRDVVYPQDSMPDSCSYFSLDKPVAGEFGFLEECLAFGDEKLLSVTELKIKGRHQVANALAALALGYAIGLPLNLMISTLKSFAGLPHRCQWVARIADVDWYNDSKGTNVGATQAAIEGLGEVINGKLILIAGGQGKGADFTLLQDVADLYVKSAILFGEDAGQIAQALDKCCNIVHVDSMQQAVKQAALAAEKGDAILLSPACASFDMFNNFEHRGDEFIKSISSLRG